MTPPTLNEALAAAGLTVDQSQSEGAPRAIRDASGAIVFEGRAGDVWKWLERRRLVTDEDLAAFAERRLTPVEARKVETLLHVDGQARAALRDLFPRVYHGLFGDADLNATPPAIVSPCPAHAPYGRLDCDDCELVRP